MTFSIKQNQSKTKGRRATIKKDAGARRCQPPHEECKILEALIVLRVLHWPTLRIAIETEYTRNKLRFQAGT